MRLREWGAGDTGAMLAIHDRMETGYRMPRVEAPLFRLKRVVEADSGEVIGGAAVKPIGECFLWVARDLPPVLRTRAFCRLMAEARVTAGAAGYDELSAWIPPQIEPEFGKALSRAGWTASPWRSWSIRI